MTPRAERDFAVEQLERIIAVLKARDNAFDIEADLYTISRMADRAFLKLHHINSEGARPARVKIP